MSDASQDSSGVGCGSSTCGCCSGTRRRTPGEIANRPGLPQIAYRSGTHGDFLASMLAALSSTQRPALARLRTRDADDPAIALLDAWAVACDVLTFYTERLANESFLRTATERTSLQELGKLVAYRLNPGLAAETWLAFSLERPAQRPAPEPPDPGLNPPAVPAAVVLPAGLRVQSVPGPGEQPQTFETVEERAARPEWNALPVVRTRLWPPTFGRRDAWLEGSALNLVKGSAILFASPDLANDRWDVRVITNIEADSAANRTHVSWAWPLGSVNPWNLPPVVPETYVLRRRIAIFGHNAPVWAAMDPGFKSGYVSQFTGETVGPEWPRFSSVTLGGTSSYVDLDGSHPDVVQGSWVAVSQEVGTFYRELYKVEGVAELSRSAFGISGKVTRLKLGGEFHAFGSPRDVTVLAVPEPLTLTEAPYPGTVGAGTSVPGTLVVDGDAAGMGPGLSIILTGTAPDGTARSEVLTLDTATPAPGGRTTMVFTTAPQDTYVRATAVVFGNVARATHGETVQQILGSGDSRKPFISFPLSQGPLTFVPAGNARGAASSLRVQIAGLEWHERDSAFGAGPGERIFVTRTDADGTNSVVFGDGIRGSRPASGSYNIRATYRKGLGAGGNLGPDTLSQPLDRPLGLKSVTNPVRAGGGVDPEPATHARASIPLPIRTLGRAVSLRDYADFALAFTGVAKADAVVLPLRSGRSVVVTIADDDGLPPPAATADRLARTLRDQGDPYVRVVVLPARTAAFRLALKIGVDPDRDRAEVIARVRHALLGGFGRAGRLLGQPVHRSALIAAAAAVPGVVAVDLDRLYRTAVPALELRLAADPSRVAPDGTPLAAELLAIADDPFDWFLEMP